MHFTLPTLGAVTRLDTGESWSGERIALEANRRASLLANHGVRRHDVVVIAHGGSPAFFADLFALWSLGATAACVNPRSATEELTRIVEHIEARAVLVDEATGLAFDAAPVICTAGQDETGEAERPALIGGNLLDDDALMLFTSGTTGTPKAVVHTFRSLLARTDLNLAYIGRDALSVTLCPLPTHFGHGLIGNCLSALFAGGQLLLMSGSDMTVIRRLGEIIDGHRVTFMSSVPALWKTALRLSASPRNGTLTRIHIGSAPLSADLWTQVVEWSGGANVVNMYGITETANWIAGAGSQEFEPRDGLIGRPWGGSLAVMDATGAIQSHGAGELLVQSPSLMQGYFRRDDLNETVLVSGWFRTGDIGEIDEDGVARLTGRQKYEINRAGLKVHPEDIDLLLERHDMVREACAFAVPDEVAGETVGVAIVPTDAAGFDLATVKIWVAERLVREKNPERWFVVDDIPKTDRGKINRDTVAAVCLNGGA
jgi:acyl-CoA synthetase (AMP-forming)/AMP-acid ligase II